MDNVNLIMMYSACAAFVYSYMALVWGTKDWGNVGIKLALVATAIFSGVLFFATIKWNPVIPPYALLVMALPTNMSWFLWAIWDKSDGINKFYKAMFLVLALGGTALIIPGILVAMGI